MLTVIPVAHRLVVRVLAFCVLGTSAMAAEATLGGVPVTVPPPSGFCELDSSEPSDARLLSSLRELLRPTGNQLLAMSADCEQLSKWRAGGLLLDDIAQYQTPQNVTANFTSETLKEICAFTRQQGAKVTSEIMPDIQKRVEDVLHEVKLNEMKFIGVVDEDANACYVVFLQKLKTELGTEKTQVALYAVTILKGKVVFYYLFRPYADNNTATTMLAKHKDNVAALLAANKN
jgi:hypothetical protein